MILDAGLRRDRFSSLARPNGTLALLAIDQRESLRTLLQKAGRESDDAAVTAFKVDVTRVLSPLASGALIDPLYGLAAVLKAGALAPLCGLIVAADYLEQPPGGAVVASKFDTRLPLDSFVANGAAALKLLVLWRRDRDRSPALRMVRAFVDRCSQLGVLSVVEGIVRGPEAGPWDRDADVIAAAEEFGSLAPDLYKAEVPTLGRASAVEIEHLSGEITRAVRCPWVVLSAGVTADIFPSAVEAACRGGASGFLAGRGIWGPSIGPVGTVDAVSSLQGDATRRLEGLVRTVDSYGRAWWDA
jgi:sulfofructosephosphate aldolase